MVQVIEQALLRQQTILAKFGELALKSHSLDHILDQACKLVSEALGTGFARILQLQKDRVTLLVRNGVGWTPGMVGHTSSHAVPGSSVAYALQVDIPICSDSVHTEARFQYDEFLRHHGIQALVNVPIPGTDGQATFGLLEVDSGTPRVFTQEDVNFLRSYSYLIANAIERLRVLEEIRSTEARLRLSEEHYRIATELNPQIPWTADPEGNTTSFDPRWLPLTGLTETQANGQGWSQVAHPDDLPPMQREWLAAVATFSPYDFTGRLRMFTGQYNWFRVRAFPKLTKVDGQTECEQWYGTVENIEERVRLEQAFRDLNQKLEGRVAESTQDLENEQREREIAESKLRQSQKMDAVGQLTGGIAHDFNNMLAGIIGSLELMQAKLVKGQYERFADYISMAMASANRAAALTHRLLAFSRQQSLVPKAISPNRLLTGLQDLISRTIGPNIQLVLALSADRSVFCDPNQLENVVLNLAINARDAMPKGGVLTLETSIAKIEDAFGASRDLSPGTYVRVAVTDTGFGMSSEVLARAYEPFFTTKAIGEGTGLGLSMAYGFLQQSGGQVRIHSVVGVGTTVSLFLPVQQGVCLAEPDSEKTELPSINGQGETILLVDDEIVVRRLIGEMLRDYGYTVLEAADSKSALINAAQLAKIDLLITDIGLPNGVSGHELARTLRDLRPNLKVLFITGFAQEASTRNDALAHGMQLLAKPFAMSILSSHVHRMLSDESLSASKPQT